MKTLIFRGERTRARLTPLFHLIAAVCAAYALVLNFNVLSGNPFVNWSSSTMPQTPAVSVMTLAFAYIFSRAEKALTRPRAGEWLLSLFLGMWWVLSQSQSVQNTVNMARPFLSSAQLLKTAVAALGMAALYMLLLGVLARLLDGTLDLKTGDGRLIALYRRHTMAFCTAAVLLMWLPHIAAAWPVNMNNDSRRQLLQVLGIDPMQANHPPLSTMLISLSVGFGRMIGSYNAGLYAYLLVQAVFGALVIGYSQSVMRGLGAPRWLRALSLAVCGLMPVYSDNITVILKDIPYCYAGLLLLCELVRAQREDGYGLRAGHALRTIAAGVLLLGIRNNGAGFIIPAAIAAAFDLIRSKRMRELARRMAVLLVPFVLIAGFEAALNAQVEVEPRSMREGLSLPFQQTARFVKEHKDEIPQEEADVIREIIRYDDLGVIYNPLLSDPVKDTYREDATAQELAAYFGVWAKQFWRDPVCYIEAVLIQNALLFDPQTYNVALFNDIGINDDVMEQLSIRRPAALQKVNDIETMLYPFLFSLPFVPQLNSMGFYCILLLAAYLFARRYRVKGMGVMLAPLVCVLVMLVLGPCIAHQDRYGFPIVYCMPLLLSCLSAGMREKVK